MWGHDARQQKEFFLADLEKAEVADGGLNGIYVAVRCCVLGRQTET